MVQLLMVLVGCFILQINGDLWVAIGTGVIGAGLAGLLAFFYVVIQDGEAARQRALERSGLVAVYERRSVSIRPEYDRLLRDAHRQIDILGFGLNSLREDFLADFPAWAQNCKVRILLLDPDAPIGPTKFADLRDEEEGQTQGSIKDEVEKFLDATSQLRAGNPNFRVRLYSAMPSVNIFRVDGRLFFGPYLLRQPSRNTPTFFVREGLLFDRLSEHFDNLWSDEFSKDAP
jgi:hypothetical protein